MQLTVGESGAPAALFGKINLFQLLFLVPCYDTLLNDLLEEVLKHQREGQDKDYGLHLGAIWRLYRGLLNFAAIRGTIAGFRARCFREDGFVAPPPPKNKLSGEVDLWFADQTKSPQLDLVRAENTPGRR
jgi:hypothetical protein